MRHPTPSKLRVARLGTLILVVLGCSGAVDDGSGEAGLPGDVASNGDEYRARSPWRPPPVSAGGTSATGGGTGGTANPTGGTGNATGGTSSGVVDCGACSTALACCNTVSGGPRCTFNQATCESLDPVRKSAYVKSCRTFIDSVVRVWRSPPDSCHL